MKQALQVLIIYFFFAFASNTSFGQFRNGPVVDSVAPAMQIKESLDKEYQRGMFDNKFVVIDFWATWCAPCIAGFPLFNEMVKKFEKDKNVVFATMTDEDRSIPELFFKRTSKELKGIRLIDDDGKTMKAFKILSIPTTVVIDDARIVRWVGYPSELQESKLDSLFKKIPATKVVVEKAKAVNPYYDPAVRAFLNRAAFGILLLKSTDTSSKENSSGGWQTNFDGDFVDVSMSRKKLLDCVAFLTGINVGPRFFVTNKEKGDYKIDLIYNLKNAIDSSFMGKYIPGKANKNYMLEMLSTTFKFHLAIKPAIIPGYQLIAIDTNQLKVFAPISAGEGITHSSESDEVDGVVEIVNKSLDDITNTLESYLKVPIKNGTGFNRKFDLTLIVKSVPEANLQLAKYGLKLEETVNKPFEIVYVDFY